MLRLTAQDTDDLSVISAQMQDAVLRLTDISYNSARRLFAVVANRYAWDDASSKTRRRAGLHFESVLNVKRLGFANTGQDTVLSLLAITFTPTDALSGFVTLAFSAGHSIRLEVECLDAVMADMGPTWSTDFQPDHAS